MNNNALSHSGEIAFAPAHSETPPSPRVLVVEDDLLIQQLNADALMRSGYSVDVVPDGLAAWHALNLETYDVVVTDNNMPRLTGVGLLKRLRAAHMELPVIMATGTVPQDEFNRYPWLTPAATLVKPFTGEALVGKVQEVLRAIEVAPEPSRPLPPSRRLSSPDNNIWP